MDQSQFQHLPAGTYYTSGSQYSGLSKQDNQHALINQRTGERVSLNMWNDVAQFSLKQKRNR